MMHFDSKAMPTNDTNYSCHIKAVELTDQLYGSISLQRLLIASCTDTHTHTQTGTHAYGLPGQNNFKKPGMCQHSTLFKILMSKIFDKLDHP